MRKVCLMFMMFIMVLSSYGGFDVGGGPGINIHKIIHFLKNSPKHLIEGTVLEGHDQFSLRLSSYQKNYVSSEVGASSEQFWGKIIQTDEDKKFVLLIVGRNSNPQNISYVLIEFDEVQLENGDLVFDLSDHAKTYLFNMQKKELIRIDFDKFYKELCQGSPCPDLHFISLK